MLEVGFQNLMRQAGVSARMEREGHIHHGTLIGKARIFKVTDSYIVASLLTDFNAEPIDAGTIVTIVH